MLRPEELLLDAVATHYVYPPQFPGFAADLHSHSRRGCVRGSIIYSPPDSLELFPTGRHSSPGPPETVSETMLEVEEMMSEMWSGGRPSRSVGLPIAYGADENSVGVLLDVLEDPERIQYRIKGRRVQQIAWVEGDNRIAATTLEVLHVDENSVLPRLTTVSRTSTVDGALISTSSIVDTYQQVGRYPLPAQRRVFSTTSEGDVYDREIHFTNPVLLSIPDTWPDTLPPG